MTYTEEDIKQAEMQGKILQTLETLVESVKRVESKLQDLQTNKMDKTEFTSYEIRITAVEKEHDKRIKKLEEGRWKMYGVAGGVGLVVAIASQVYDYIK